MDGHWCGCWFTLLASWLMNAWGAWDHVPPSPPPAPQTIIVQLGSLITLCHN